MLVLSRLKSSVPQFTNIISTEGQKLQEKDVHCVLTRPSCCNSSTKGDSTGSFFPFVVKDVQAALVLCNSTLKRKCKHKLGVYTTLLKLIYIVQFGLKYLIVALIKRRSASSAPWRLSVADYLVLLKAGKGEARGGKW